MHIKYGYIYICLEYILLFLFPSFGIPSLLFSYNSHINLPSTQYVNSLVVGFVYFYILPIYPMNRIDFKVG